MLREAEELERQALEEQYAIDVNNPRKRKVVPKIIQRQDVDAVMSRSQNQTLKSEGGG